MREALRLQHAHSPHLSEGCKACAWDDLLAEIKATPGAFVIENGGPLDYRHYTVEAYRQAAATARSS